MTTIEEIKKLIDKCPKSPDSSTWTRHQYSNVMKLYAHRLSKKFEYQELLRPLFDCNNEFLGTVVLDYPQTESIPIPYDLTTLIADCPDGADSATWTDDQRSAVETLHEVYVQVKHWEWGDDEDWIVLEPLFDSEGDYIGKNLTSDPCLLTGQ